MEKSKQESCGDLYELARDYARAETRDVGIESLRCGLRI